MQASGMSDYLAEQGARIRIAGAEPYLLSGSTDIAFLALHGWAASAESLRFVAQGLFAAGHTVLVPTLPGHGTSPADMVRFGPVDWNAAAEEGLKVLRQQFEKVFVLGVSMGGALALQLAATNGNEIAGVVTVNAPVLMSRPEFAREIASAPSGASLGGWQIPAFKGPEVPEISYPVRYKKSGADLYAMCGIAREILPLVISPLLILQALADPVVPQASAEEILENAGSTDKQIVWLDNSYHVSQLDLDRDRIVQETLDFVGTGAIAWR